jgi:hypothetical protein
MLLQTFEHRRIVESLYMLTEYCDLDCCRQFSTRFNLTYVFPAKIDRNVLCKFYSKTIKSKASERKQDWSNNDQWIYHAKWQTSHFNHKIHSTWNKKPRATLQENYFTENNKRQKLYQSYDGGKM